MGDSTVLLPELARLITEHLSPFTRRSLCNTTRSFGRQPTSELITRLVLALPASDCCQQERIQERLPHIGALTISGPPGQQGCLEPRPLVLPCPHLPQLINRVCPLMPHLTNLHLCNIGLDAVAGAAASLGSSCLRLADLELHDSTDDVWPNARALSRALRALAARVPTLRRLKLAVLLPASEHGSGELLSLHGVGALTQLRSLSVCSRDGQAYLLPRVDLSCLAGLTKLSLHDVSLGAPQGTMPCHLTSLSQLRRLKMLEAETACSALEKFAAFSACPQLTSLRLSSTSGQQLMAGTPDAPASFFDSWNALRPSYTQLVRLDLNITDLSMDSADVLDMPASLRALRCEAISLPPAGCHGALLPHVRVLDCNLFMRPLVNGEEGGADPAWPAARSLAQTFPHLVSLRWGRPAATLNTRLCAWSQLLPATPEGRMSHLRHLACDWLEAPLLGGCMGAVQDLVVGRAQWLDDDDDDDDDGAAARRPLGVLVSQLQAGGPRPRRVELCDPHARDADVAALVAAWPDVEEVVIRDSGDLSDAGLAAVAGLLRLSRVTLVRCPAITQEGVKLLVARWSVKYIKLCRCAQVGKLEVARIHDAPGGGGFGLRPRLDVVQSDLEKKAVPWWRAGEGAAA